MPDELGDLHQLRMRAEREFETQFSMSPRWAVAAPGRVNLIGEHVDYNGGFVLPMAIERYVVIVAAPVASDEVDVVGGGDEAVFFSDNLQESCHVSLGSPREPRPGNWSSYLAGVVAGFLKREQRMPPFRALIRSSVPLGGGLASSAALAVATATLLETVIGETLDDEEKALLCLEAEHQYAGVPCGIMDQFCSVFGRENSLLLLDCRSRAIEHVPFSSPEITVLITDSQVKHELGSGAYARRRSDCERAAETLKVESLRDVGAEELGAAERKLDAREYRRARHVVSEIARTRRAAKAVRDKQWDAVGKLMYESHASLRDDYEVSCAELDTLVDIARDIGPAGGVLGARMTGGGFGGCTVSLVRARSAPAVAEAIRSAYFEKVGIEPVVFASRPAKGAHVLSSG